jgi:hypothetical protein
VCAAELAGTFRGARDLREERVVARLELVRALGCHESSAVVAAGFLQAGGERPLCSEGGRTPRGQRAQA